MSLDGKVALVTGPSSGLGRRFTRTLAEAGAGVVVGARHVAALDDFMKEIRELTGAIVLDVSDVHAWNRSSRLATHPTRQHVLT